MQFTFEETPITIRTEDGGRFPAGMFDGDFEIDEIGMIQTITLKQYEGNGSLTLRRWKPGDKAPGFRHRLFDALAKTLAAKWEDEINEFLGELHDWPTRAQEQAADRAYYHSQVL